MTDRYAVIGNPVAHSRSPAIHAEFARQTRQAMSYSAICPELADFEDAVSRFFDEGGQGLNVTVPFKARAYRLAGAKTPRAERAQAVNTLTLRDGLRHGDNTDGAGLLRDLIRNLGFDPAGRRVLLMGAGGAAYGVAGPLLERAPAALVVANRTLDKAIALCERFAPDASSVSLRAAEYGALTREVFDLVINATSAGLVNAMPPLPDTVFAPEALAYDLVYGRETPFLALARRQRARTADGLGMLVEQAAESFHVWRGVRPDTAPVIALLRTRLP